MASGIASRLKPLFDRVLISKAEKITTTKGGIMLPDKAVGKVLEGVVVAVGPGARSKMNHLPLPKVYKLGTSIRALMMRGSWCNTLMKVDNDGIAVKDGLHNKAGVVQYSNIKFLDAKPILGMIQQRCYSMSQGRDGEKIHKDTVNLDYKNRSVDSWRPPWVEYIENSGQVYREDYSKFSRDDLLVYVGKLKSDLNSLQKKLDVVVIPLTIREYATSIKRMYPEIVPNVSPNLLKGKQLHEKWLMEEKSVWIQIFNEHPDDPYVNLVIRELERTFREKNGLDAIDGKWVDVFEEEKAKLGVAIAKAVDFANKLVAHRDSGAMPFREKLNLYDNFVDPRATIFYNAILTTPP